MGARAHRWQGLVIVGVAVLLAGMEPAEAGIVRGLQKIVMGVFQPPLSTLTGTFTGPPVLGTAFGAVGGTIRGVGLIVSGAFEVAAGVVPIAKAVAPYVFPFLL